MKFEWKKFYQNRIVQWVLVILLFGQIFASSITAFALETTQTSEKSEKRHVAYEVVFEAAKNTTFEGKSDKVTTMVEEASRLKEEEIPKVKLQNDQTFKYWEDEMGNHYSNEQLQEIPISEKKKFKTVIEEQTEESTVTTRESFTEESTIETTELEKKESEKEQASDPVIEKENKAITSLGTSVDVTDWNSYVAAINNASVSIINIKNSFSRPWNLFSYVGTIDRDLIINGNNHVIDFGSGANSGRGIQLAAMDAANPRTLVLNEFHYTGGGSSQNGYVFGGAGNNWTIQIQNVIGSSTSNNTLDLKFIETSQADVVMDGVQNSLQKVGSGYMILSKNFTLQPNAKFTVDGEAGNVSRGSGGISTSEKTTLKSKSYLFSRGSIDDGHLIYTKDWTVEAEAEVDAENYNNYAEIAVVQKGTVDIGRSAKVKVINTRGDTGSADTNSQTELLNDSNGIAGTIGNLFLRKASELFVKGSNGIVSVLLKDSANSSKWDELILEESSKLEIETTYKNQNSRALSGSIAKFHMDKESQMTIDAQGAGFQTDISNAEFQMVDQAKANITLSDGIGFGFYDTTNADENVKISNINVRLAGAGTELTITSHSRQGYTHAGFYVRATDSSIVVEDNALLDTKSIGGNMDVAFTMQGKRSKLKVAKGATLRVFGKNQNSNFSAAFRARRAGQMTIEIDGGTLEVKKQEGNSGPAMRLYGGGNNVIVKNGGLLTIYSPVTDSSGGGLQFEGANDGDGPNNFNLEGQGIVDGKERGSTVRIKNDVGPGIYTPNQTYIKIGPKTNFYVSANQDGSAGAVFRGGGTNLNIELDHPNYFDFKNYSKSTTSGHHLIASSGSGSSLTASNTALAVWNKGRNVDGEPLRDWSMSSFKLTGSGFDKVESSSISSFKNDYGDTKRYSRLSANNAPPTIEKIRTPTNADQRIFVYVKVMEGIDGLRPAKDKEAYVIVKVKDKNSHDKYPDQTLIGSTKGNEISVYGDPPIKGIAEIVLPNGDYLEEGDQIEVLEAWRGEETGGTGSIFASAEDILDNNKVTYDVTPPSPIRQSQIINLPLTRNSTFIEGNAVAEPGDIIKIYKNGAYLGNTVIENNKYWKYELGSETLAGNDELTFVVTDSNAQTANLETRDKEILEQHTIGLNDHTTGVLGNENPINRMEFHDRTFEKSFTLLVRPEYVCRIGDKGYETLEKAIEDSNKAGTSTSPVKIEMLVDEYEVMEPMVVKGTVGGKTGSVIITTAPPKDSDPEPNDEIKYQGVNTRSVIQIKMDLPEDSPLFKVEDEATLTFQNVLLDGNGQENDLKSSLITTTSSGGVVFDTDSVLEDHGDGPPAISSRNSHVWLKGGVIRKNLTDSEKGVIHNGPSSILYFLAGSITNNKAKKGGAIFNEGTIRMSKGTITGNAAESLAGGIFQDGTFEVGEFDSAYPKGKIEIDGNILTDGQKRNVYLPKTSVSVTDDPIRHIKVASNLTDDTVIGVMTDTSSNVGDRGIPKTIIAVPKGSYSTIASQEARFVHDQLDRNENAYQILKDPQNEQLILHRIDTRFKFKKISSADVADPSNAEGLSDANFTLYKCESDHSHDGLATEGSCWQEFRTRVSVSDGKVDFGLLQNGEYMLVETQAPAGYETPRGQWHIQVEAVSEEPLIITARSVHGSNGGTATNPGAGKHVYGTPPAFMIDSDNLYLPNMKEFLLPFSGNKGIYQYLLLGGTAMVSALGFYLYKRTKQRKDQHEVFRC